MINIGAARALITIETPTAGVDAMGAPTMTWATYATAYAELEGDHLDQSETTATGPRKEVTRSSTLIVRCHPAQMFSPSMRVVTSDNQILAINAARYDSKHTRAYLDVVGGQSSGGLP